MKILFQGDSITDCMRSREDLTHMGWGYAMYASRILRERHPDIDFEFVNRGISGNRTDNLVARWTEDAIVHQPDILSVMVGVNDTWHFVDNKNWVPNEVFEANYRNILERTKKETNAKIIMLEQYLLPSEDKDWFREDINPKIMITRKLAREYADIYIPVDGLLMAACVDKPSLYWSEDAVHLNDNGSAFVAKYYADAVDTLIERFNMK